MDDLEKEKRLKNKSQVFGLDKWKVVKSIFGEKKKGHQGNTIWSGGREHDSNLEYIDF